MELTVENNPIVLPDAGSISIEKNSPVFHDNVGAFSYPFPVPTDENASSLGYPGRQERANDIPDKNFSLLENGLKILSGNIDFDSTTREETGLILKSGNSEFSKKVEKKLISDLNLGSEDGYTSFTQAAIQAKLDEWNTRNAQTYVSDYVCCPFAVKDTDGNQVIVNEVTNDSGTAKLTMPAFDSNDDFSHFFCFQFGAGWLVQKIYEALGYTVSSNIITSDSFLRQFVVFGKIIRIYSDTYWVGSGTVDADGHLNLEPGSTLYVTRNIIDPFEYGTLAPDWDIANFISSVKMALGVVIDIDERLKKVSIYKKKSLFDKSNIVEKGEELEDYSHDEDRSFDGFKIEYKTQDDDLAVESDLEISGYVDNEANLPDPGSEYKDKIILAKDTSRYFKCTYDSSTYSWEEIGRLQSYSRDNGENEYSIDVTVPYQVAWGDIDIPEINYVLQGDKTFEDLGKMAMTLFRSGWPANSVVYPLLSFDRFSLDASRDYTSSMKPEYLYTVLYKLFVDWQTYRARKCIKYLAINLADAVSLRYDQRLKISGIPILIDKIIFELPFIDVIKIDGYMT